MGWHPSGEHRVPTDVQIFFRALVLAALANHLDAQPTVRGIVTSGERVPHDGALLSGGYRFAAGKVLANGLRSGLTWRTSTGRRFTQVTSTRYDAAECLLQAAVRCFQQRAFPATQATRLLHLSLPRPLTPTMRR